MNVLDIFSGIGGFSKGLHDAGFKTVGFCEMDKNCQEVLKKNFPDIPIYDDVTELKGERFKNVDVIAGGFPCTDVSIAGGKDGFKSEKSILSSIERELKEIFINSKSGKQSTTSGRDFQKLCDRVSNYSKTRKADRTRSGLWEEFKRLIKEIRPRYAIIENVGNLRSQGLNEIIKDLWEIGYASEWHIISARSIGAPHLRERVWIIAYPDSGQLWDEQGWFERKGRREGLALSGDDGKARLATRKARDTSNSHGPRLWRSHATEEEAQRWWTEATSKFRNWWPIESESSGMDDGISEGLHKDLEKKRQVRISQLGNSIVPFIAEFIGREIMRFERGE